MYFLRNLISNATPLYATHTFIAIQIPNNPQPIYFEKYKTGINPKNVAPNSTFRRYFISPNPLKIESKVNASAFKGRLIKTIKNIPYNIVNTVSSLLKISPRGS